MVLSKRKIRETQSRDDVESIQRCLDTGGGNSPWTSMLAMTMRCEVFASRNKAAFEAEIRPVSAPGEAIKTGPWRFLAVEIVPLTICYANFVLASLPMEHCGMHNL